MKVEEQADRVSVDTGPARFVFVRKQFGCPSEVWVDLNQDGEAETQATAGPAEFVCEVEHTPSGPPNEPAAQPLPAPPPATRPLPPVSHDRPAKREEVRQAVAETPPAPQKADAAIEDAPLPTAVPRAVVEQPVEAAPLRSAPLLPSR